MTQLLVFREQLQKLYQKYSWFLNPLFCFSMGMIVFSSLNRMIGYQPALKHFYVELLLAALSVIMPAGGMVVVAAVFIVIHIFYVSNILSVVIGLVFLLCYFAFVKFVPGHAYTILSVPVACSLNLVYGIPVLMGLIATPLSILPVTIGLVIYYLLQAVISVVSNSTDSSINLYQAVLTQFTNNKEMYAMLLVSAMVIILVYLLRSQSWNYAFEISIVMGTLCNIIFLLITHLMLDSGIGVLRLMVGSLFSGVIVWLIQFMRLALNYSGAEHVQFEDDEYYYYVKAVPKMNVAAPEKNVKRFNARRFSDYRKNADTQAGKESLPEKEL